jgi:hypothetical protein
MVTASSFQRKSLAGELHLQRVKFAGYGWGFQTFFTELYSANGGGAVAAENEERSGVAKRGAVHEERDLGGGRRAQITLKSNLPPDVSLRLTCRSP